MTLLATPPPLIVDYPAPPPGTWEREASHFPFPVSPFTKSLLLMESWSRRITAETGSLIETVRFIEIGGWVYMRPVPFGERPGAPKPPEWLVPLLMRLVPSVRRRMATAQAAQVQDWSGRQIDLWYNRRGYLAGRITALGRADLAAMTDCELDDHLRAAIALGHECLELHFRLHSALARDLRAFTVTCRELLDWDDRRACRCWPARPPRRRRPADPWSGWPIWRVGPTSSHDSSAVRRSIRCWPPTRSSPRHSPTTSSASASVRSPMTSPIRSWPSDRNSCSVWSAISWTWATGQPRRATVRP